MPRARGGAHAQRTDLNQPVQPVHALPSRVYGDGVRQEADLAANPLPAVDGAPHLAPVPSAPRPLPPALNDPTRRPDEPVTAGAPIGPGPGPEVLGLQPQDLVGTLDALARQSPAVAELAAYVASGRR